jgi:hypothetical protein
MMEKKGMLMLVRGCSHWRVPFLEKPEHSEFRTWIYGFTVSLFMVSGAQSSVVAEAINAVGRSGGGHAVPRHPKE